MARKAGNSSNNSRQGQGRGYTRRRGNSTRTSLPLVAQDAVKPIEQPPQESMKPVTRPEPSPVKKWDEHDAADSRSKKIARTERRRDRATMIATKAVEDSRVPSVPNVNTMAHKFAPVLYAQLGGNARAE